MKAVNWQHLKIEIESRLHWLIRQRLYLTLFFLGTGLKMRNFKYNFFGSSCKKFPFSKNKCQNLNELTGPGLGPLMFNMGHEGHGVTDHNFMIYKKKHKS